MTIANGQPKTIDALRDDYRRVRLETRLAEARAQKQLLEGFNWGMGLPSFAGGWDWPGDPFVAPGLSGPQLWFPLGGASAGHREKKGDPPFIQTEQQLDGVRIAARLTVQTNQYAANVVETKTDFIAGEKGITFRAVPRKGRRVPDELVESIQEAVDEFAGPIDPLTQVSPFSELQCELIARDCIDGESFLRYYPQADGTLQVRVVEPEHIRQPLGSPKEWSWGILSAMGDVQREESYAANYDDVDDWEEVSAGYMLHSKLNVVRTVKRGLSDFYATAEWFESAKKLLTNSCVGESVRAALVGFWEYAQASGTTVGAHVAARRDTTQPYTRHPITGKEPNFQHYAPGSIPHVPANKKFVPPPGSPNAQAQVGILQATLRSLGVRWSFPEYLVSGDASNANLASLLVSGSPFSRRVRRWQGYYKPRFAQIAWMAVRTAHAAGRLRGAPARWEDVPRLVDLQAEAAPPELANEAELAGIDHADMDRGVLSIQTRRQRRGLDDEQETMNLKEKPLPQAGGMPDTGQGLPDRSVVAQPIASLQSEFYAGKLPREAAIANVQMLFGFSAEEASSLFPVIAPVKLTPEEEKPAGPAVGGEAQPPEGGEPPRGVKVPDFFPAIESRLAELRQHYGPDTAATVARAAGMLLQECGGKGGKPGPCPYAVEQAPSPKAARAKETHKPSTKAKQDHAKANQDVVAKGLGGQGVSDNAPTDVVVPAARGKVHGVEVKTMLDNDNDRIKMNKESYDRKARWAADTGNMLHTSVTDDRDVFDGGKNAGQYSGQKMYYKRGGGSFTTAGMHPVESHAEMRRLMDLPDHQLPEKAKPLAAWTQRVAEAKADKTIGAQKSAMATAAQRAAQQGVKK